MQTHRLSMSTYPVIIFLIDFITAVPTQLPCLQQPTDHLCSSHLPEQSEADRRHHLV